MTLRKPSFIFLATLLMLIYFASRLMYIEAFPVFIDETVHIYTQESISRTGIFYDAHLGRLFTGWWLFIFQPHLSDNPIWLARVVVLIMSMLSVASLMAVARLLATKGVALVAGLLLLFSSYHFFFERLVLSDLISASATLLAIYFALRVRKRINYGDAFWVGVFLFIAFFAKVGALPYWGIPFAAAIFSGVSWQVIVSQWRSRLIWLSIALGTTITLSGAMLLVLRWRGYDYIGNSLSLAVSNRADFDANQTFDLARISMNIRNTLDVLSGYWGVGMLLLVLVALVYLLLRYRGVFLILLAPLFAMWVSVPQETRYWIVPMALALLGVALLAEKILQWRWGQGVAIVCIGVWALTQTLPFWSNANTPLATPLPDTDIRQYVNSDASGVPFMATAQFLRDAGATRIIGLLSSCNGLRYSAPDLPIECPSLLLDGSAIPDHERLIDAVRGQPGVFVVLEDNPYVPDAIDAPIVYQASRPTGLATLTVYQLAR